MERPAMPRAGALGGRAVAPRASTVRRGALPRGAARAAVSTRREACRHTGILHPCEQPGLFPILESFRAVNYSTSPKPLENKRFARNRPGRGGFRPCRLTRNPPSALALFRLLLGLSSDCQNRRSEIALAASGFEKLTHSRAISARRFPLSTRAFKENAWSASFCLCLPARGVQ